MKPIVDQAHLSAVLRVIDLNHVTTVPPVIEMLRECFAEPVPGNPLDNMDDAIRLLPHGFYVTHWGQSEKGWACRIAGPHLPGLEEDRSFPRNTTPARALVAAILRYHIYGNIP